MRSFNRLGNGVGALVHGQRVQRHIEPRLPQLVEQPTVVRAP